MKPPTRTTRSTRNASQWFKRKPIVNAPCDQDSDEKWSNGELRNIIAGIKHQYKSGLDDIDTCALQTRVPNRSVPEVELLLKAVKLSVGKKVHFAVKKQRKEEQQDRVPIQIWCELMERIAGKHEEKASSAFSRVLVIAGTEPCSLQHSHPPCKPENQSSATMTVRTISKFSAGSSMNTRAQVFSTANVRQPSGKEGIANSNIPNPHLSTIQSISATQDVHSKTQATSVPAISSSLQGQLSQSNQMDNPSEFDTPEHTVNFEKIYTFLSSACKSDGETPLTAMESAVVLDLIMSLPEELPRMDCQNLLEHFLQVYLRLTSSVKVPLKSQASAPANGAGEASSGIETDELMQTVSRQTKVALTWDNVGICPLNPLMVPLSLLVRKRVNRS